MNAFGSHLGPLGLALGITTGPVLEIGMGYFSTHMLHSACWPHRELVSVEENETWFSMFAEYQCEHHSVRHAACLASFLAIDLGRWSVAFIDGGIYAEPFYDTRLLAVEKLRAVTDIVVIHDTEDTVRYRNTRWNDLFTYLWTFKPPGLPWTTLASQTVDIKKALCLL